VKRPLAVFILSVFLLNVLGSYGLFLGLKANAGEELAEKLDSDMYDLGASVTFKIPFSIPYGTDSKTYERMDGQFEKDGVVYRMVKTRLYHDVLYIVCVKDQKSSKINNTLSDIAQGFGGQDDGEKSVAQTLIKDYVNTEIALTRAINGWQSDVINTETVSYFFDSYFSSIVHPPDRPDVA
jgi:hypothetical protein